MKPAADEYLLAMRESYRIFANEIPKIIKKRINSAVENVLKYNPYKSERLDPPLEGLRSHHVGREGFRIIFAICEECRGEGYQMLNGCPECETFPDRTVMLFTCGPHWVYRRMREIRQSR